MQHRVDYKYTRNFQLVEHSRVSGKIVRLNILFLAKKKDERRDD